MKYLIVGLGNVGSDYINTRHNIGFDIVDGLSDHWNATFELKRHAMYASASFRGRKMHLIKPTTYMNLSGKAVNYWKNALNIHTDRMLVVVDDIALPFGKIRLRKSGSDGGHNGLKDITYNLSTNVYPRLRFGIGDDFRKGRQADYVLGKWTFEQQEQISDHIGKVIPVIEDFVILGIDRTMNKYN